MANLSADPCEQPRAALNQAEHDLLEHRAMHGESDDAGDAPWGEERARLLDVVTGAIAAFEDCIRLHDPQLLGASRPHLSPTPASSSVPDSPPSPGAHRRPDDDA